MRTDAGARSRRISRDILIGMVVLGSVWGLSEVILNDAIRAYELPWRAGILAGVGMLWMGIGLGLIRSPWLLVGLPIAAACLKQLVVPILHVSVLCKANSCLAIGLQAFCLAGVVGMAGRRAFGGGFGRATMGAGAALGSALPFYFIGLRLAPCPYLLSFGRPEGLGAFMLTEGLVWAAFAGLGFPLGYRLGTTLADPVGSLHARKPLVYYGSAAGLTLFCWAVAALRISAAG